MSLGTVYWEESTKEREVTHVCSRCQERARYGRITDLGDVSIVGPRGVAHIQHEWNLERTLCGRNATGTDWWWRL